MVRFAAETQAAVAACSDVLGPVDVEKNAWVSQRPATYKQIISRRRLQSQTKKEQNTKDTQTDEERSGYIRYEPSQEPIRIDNDRKYNLPQSEII